MNQKGHCQSCYKVLRKAVAVRKRKGYSRKGDGICEAVERNVRRGAFQM